MNQTRNYVIFVNTINILILEEIRYTDHQLDMHENEYYYC